MTVSICVDLSNLPQVQMRKSVCSWLKSQVIIYLSINEGRNKTMDNSLHHTPLSMPILRENF